jgi:hypothetical protein
LIDALDATTRGHAARIWWHLEPDGYFLHFEPVAGRIRMRLDFAPESIAAHSKSTLSIDGSPGEILLPFWRFARKFQAGAYREPDWPEVDYRVLDDIEHRIKHTHPNEAHPRQQENL